MKREDTHISEDGDYAAKGEESRLHPMLRLLYLLVAPITGWKRLKNARFKADVYARKVFFPLLSLMALSRFAPMFYGASPGLARTLQLAISEFVAGFAGYFVVISIGRSFLPAEARQRIASPFGRVYAMTCLSILALAATVYQLVPGLGALYLVAPIYAAYLMVKGIRFLRIPYYEQNGTTLLLTCLLMAVPLGIYYILEALMPAV